MENRRPNLYSKELNSEGMTDYALMKSMYFYKDNLAKEDTDPIERWERMQSKSRNLNNNSR